MSAVTVLSEVTKEAVARKVCALSAHSGISVYEIGATPTVLLFIKFGLIRLLPWRPLNCAPWLRAIKLKIGMPRDHHEIPRLPGARVAAPTGTRAIAVSRRGYQLGLR